jgi:ferredoxin
MAYGKRVMHLFLSLWPFTHALKKVSPYPPFKWLLAPVVGEDVFQVTFIPVCEDIPTPQDTVIPRQAVAELIKASSHRFIYNGCICRRKEGCVNYPQDKGCIFLGEAASRLHPSLGHQAGVEECLNHAEELMDMGLTAMIGRLWMDATAMGVLRDFSKFLVLCFCCDCCCLVRTDMRKVPPQLKRGIKKLEAVSVRVTERCLGCGTCVESCFVAAVSLREGKANIDQDLCKACGRCAVLCPQQAIQVEFDTEDALWRELLARVRPAINP